ncbi:hypothetical protein IX329_001016 [Fusobacterium necrophorum]|nr:hypothetical protein [Fusobacterium necrophorum]MBR8733442.1 hypothetical protein [Fusobacterium necrophorum]MBR8789619.1 hypothetical protein [Fusobacterium necrophorum]
MKQITLSFVYLDTSCQIGWRSIFVLKTIWAFSENLQEKLSVKIPICFSKRYFLEKEENPFSRNAYEFLMAFESLKKKKHSYFSSFNEEEQKEFIDFIEDSQFIIGYTSSKHRNFYEELKDIFQDEYILLDWRTFYKEEIFVQLKEKNFSKEEYSSLFTKREKTPEETEKFISWRRKLQYGLSYQITNYMHLTLLKKIFYQKDIETLKKFRTVFSK